MNKYIEAARQLSDADRQRVGTCLRQQNRISELLTCATDCEQLSDLPAVIQAPVTELFTFAFKLLSDLGVRDSLYEVVYQGNAYHVCPFCGSEYFDAPGAPREDLDHYLSRTRYPFAATNLRNLVPMGMKCNQRYKLNQDILRTAAGVRRSSFDPYGVRQISVDLMQSVPFAGADGQLPDWQIQFEPDAPECVTWDDVFDVRRRMARDVLDASFRRWLGEFAAWFKKRIGAPEPDEALVVNAVGTYAEDIALTGFNAREFLRAPVFRMLHGRCEAGDERLRALMRSIVLMS